MSDTNAPSPELQQLDGAISHGPDAGQARQQLLTAYPEKRWLHAQPLAHLVGAEDSRFPASHPAVIDLELAGQPLLDALRRPPADWWPLMQSLGTAHQWLHFLLPPGTVAAQPVRYLSGRFPQTPMLIDAFIHGPQGGWQAHVRLAEQSNIWVTTRGLLLDQGLWTARAASEAMHFAMGEIGASKVLFASGRRWSQPIFDARKWLQELGTLDDAQQSLILGENARELFAP
ncbi:MAG TPA: amidohydrolase family protein [Planctomycetota bacterium]